MPFTAHEETCPGQLGSISIVQAADADLGGARQGYKGDEAEDMAPPEWRQAQPIARHQAAASKAVRLTQPRAFRAETPIRP